LFSLGEMVPEVGATGLAFQPTRAWRNDLLRPDSELKTKKPTQCRFLFSLGEMVPEVGLEPTRF
ncbi:hypothetical protein, partial [Shewanella chilikensis]|uniref:hypothetical protein n=1 Tax=Shewanella chilikensis TaxID=558541 RepID=UPI001E504ADC